MDLLTGVMERLVELFPNELIPFSVQLCTQLTESFLRIMQDSQAAIVASGDPEADDWDINGDRLMAAMGMLKTICTLVLGVPDEMEHREALLEQLELAFVPVVQYTLQQEVVDLYDEVFELLDSATFQLKRITPCMWNLFPVIHGVLLKGGAIDFMEGIIQIHISNI